MSGTVPAPGQGALEQGNGIVPLLVVGAGPHALALVSKILEATTDPLEEAPHNRVLFKEKAGNATAVPDEADRPTPPEPSSRRQPRLVPSAKFDTMSDATMRRLISAAKANKKGHGRRLEHIMVVDQAGGWMSQWNSQFDLLEIPHLRSGITAHPGPIHMQTLDHYAIETKRRESGVVPLDLPRANGYEGPYDAPTTELFAGFTSSVVKRYSLHEKVVKGRVESIEPAWMEADGELAEGAASANCEGRRPHVFNVKLEGGVSLRAERVVVAHGPLSQPAWPDFVHELPPGSLERARAAGSLAHSTDLLVAGAKLDDVALAQRRFLVVGGGLTAGHLAAKLLKRKQAAGTLRMADKDPAVVLCARRALRRRQYDLELRWMGRQRHQHLAREFWPLSDEDRLALIRSAKDGGSITPEVLACLLQHRDTGALEIQEGVEVASITWRPREQGAGDGGSDYTVGSGEWFVSFTTGETGLYDVIWSASGTTLSARTDPLLRDTLAFAEAEATLHPRILEDAVPVVTEACRLVEGLDLFLMGKYAGLQLGPGAVNLMGARAGAARICHALRSQCPVLFGAPASPRIAGTDAKGKRRARKKGAAAVR